MKALRAAADNLQAGAKLALFRPVASQAFHVSWGHFWFMLALYAAVICGYDYWTTEAPREFYPRSGLMMVLTRSALVLLAATLAGWLLRPAQHILALAVITLSGFLLPWCVMLAADIALSYAPAKRDIGNDLQIIKYCWLYLVAFRAATLLSNSLRAFFAAALLTGAFLISSYLFAGEFWYHDYSDARGEKAERLVAEDVLQNQHVLMDQAIAQLKPPAEKRAIYGLIFGSYSYQDVFMKEARFVEDTLARLFNMRGRMLVMINNEKTVKTVPLATSVNLRAALKAVAVRMRKDDIALLYLTSHGGKQSGLSVEMGYNFDLHDIKPAMLAEMLKESGIRNRIVIVSACYSGTMLEPLQDPNTLVITAADKDHTSFGCSDEADLTYFADAYFKQALPKSRNFITAFDVAKKFVTEREKKEGITPASNPQIFVGDNIRKLLLEK
jgi:hypothetical protein